MNDHTRISDLLPLYVSGALDRAQALAVESHLAGCTECQADLSLWKAVSEEIVEGDRRVSAPRGLADRALGQARSSQGSSFGVFVHLWGLVQFLHSQMPLVQREIWPASAAVIGLGFIVAVIADQSGFIYALAPMIAAACVSFIYGPENDPAYELTLSTPTSPRAILLARLVLVFGYNLGLVLIATLGLQPALHQWLFGDLVLAWLAPMTFLSAAALVLSVWIGATNAISIAYVAWLAQLFGRLLRSPQADIRLSSSVQEIIILYQNFWQAPALLLALSALLFAAAIWLAGRQERGLLKPLT